MKLAFELPPAQAEKLRLEAERLGLLPEDLARAALTDLLASPDPVDRNPSTLKNIDEPCCVLEVFRDRMTRSGCEDHDTATKQAQKS